MKIDKDINKRKILINADQLNNDEILKKKNEQIKNGNKKIELLGFEPRTFCV